MENSILRITNDLQQENTLIADISNKKGLCIDNPIDNTGSKNTIIREFIEILGQI